MTEVIPEGTPEWVKARVGNLGASMMPTVMLPLNKEKSEKAARSNLRKQIVAERLTCFAVDHYVSPAMQHGLQWESQAKAEYEAYSGNLVLPAGWCSHPRIEFAGATPDGFIDDDGVLECKCPTTGTHIEYVLGGVVPEDYKPQMAFQLLCTGRQFADFVSFDPRIQGKQRLFVRRWVPPAEYLSEVEAAAVKFLQEVDAMFEQVVTA